MRSALRGRGGDLAAAVERVSPAAAGAVVSALVAVRARKVTPVAPSLVGGVLSPSRRILVKETSLRRGMVLGKIFAANRYRPVLDPKAPHDASVHVASPRGRYVVNGAHEGNEKTRVANAWEAASGVPLAVDPLTYDGEMVEKSDKNATHDGRVLKGPISPENVEDGKVYQRLIDNSDGAEVVDLRISIHGDRIPFVYLKRRPLNDRFSNTNRTVSMAETDEIFSAEEQAMLVRFGKSVGLDFGEADVLRDNASGQIWVVDSTNGPSGPPNGLSAGDARRALARLAEAFDEMLVSRAGL